MPNFLLLEGAKDLTMESMHVPDPVMSFSIRPAKDKTEKVFQDALVRFSKEDPSFTYNFDQDAEEFQINGMGELHLEIYAQRMEREYNCPVILGIISIIVSIFIAFSRSAKSPIPRNDFERNRI